MLITEYKPILFTYWSKMFGSFHAMMLEPKGVDAIKQFSLLHTLLKNVKDPRFYSVTEEGLRALKLRISDDNNTFAFRYKSEEVIRVDLAELKAAEAKRKAKREAAIIPYTFDD